SDLPPHIFSEMRHFFSVYKNLEDKETVVDEVKGREEAKQIIQDCLDNYVEKFCR
ncbi:MAG: inorganic diphosphatase, partial [Oscillospiraceae bacterium]